MRSTNYRWFIIKKKTHTHSHAKVYIEGVLMCGKHSKTSTPHKVSRIEPTLNGALPSSQGHPNIHRDTDEGAATRKCSEDVTEPASPSPSSCNTRRRNSTSQVSSSLTQGDPFSDQQSQSRATRRRANTLHPASHFENLPPARYDPIAYRHWNHPVQWWTRYHLSEHVVTLIRHRVGFVAGSGSDIPALTPTVSSLCEHWTCTCAALWNCAQQTVCSLCFYLCLCLSLCLSLCVWCALEKCTRYPTDFFVCVSHFWIMIARVMD